MLYLPRGCEYGYEPSLTHDSALAIIQCDAAYSWNTIVTQMLQVGVDIRQHGPSVYRA